MLSVALKKGDIDAFALGYPLAWVVRDRDGLTALATTLSGASQPRAC